ncbi:MAG: methylamine utilization protein MauE [Betaproteobacteria bacterium]|nr:methylamine utilization protein MauE [Betaproteobacteria bacterium]
MNDPVAAGIIVGAMVLILLGAAWHKFSEPNAFLAALAGYRIAPDASLSMLSRIIPGIEIALAGALLLPVTRMWALRGAAILMAAYAIAIAVNLLRGRSYIDCGCGGTAHPLSWGLVLRNIVLAAAALAVSGPTIDRGFDWLDGVALVMGVLAFYVTYLMADELMRQASRMTRTRPHQETELAP